MVVFVVVVVVVLSSLSSSSSSSGGGGSGGDGYMGPFYGPQCKIRLYDTPAYTHFANGVLDPTIL